MTSSPHPIPAPLMLEKGGSFVSLDWGCCWFWGSEDGRVGNGESTELRVRCLRPGLPLLLCDLGLGPSLSGPQLPLPALWTTSVICNGEAAQRFRFWNGEPHLRLDGGIFPSCPHPGRALRLGWGLAGVAAGWDKRIPERGEGVCEVQGRPSQGESALSTSWWSLTASWGHGC